MRLPTKRFRQPREQSGSHAAAAPGAFERAAARMPNSAQRLLRSAEMRKRIDVPRVSFESMMRKRARSALAIFGDKGSSSHPKRPIT